MPHIGYSRTRESEAKIRAELLERLTTQKTRAEIKVHDQQGKMETLEVVDPATDAVRTIVHPMPFDKKRIVWAKEPVFRVIQRDDGLEEIEGTWEYTMEEAR